MKRNKGKAYNEVLSVLGIKDSLTFNSSHDQ